MRPWMLALGLALGCGPAAEEGSAGSSSGASEGDSTGDVQECGWNHDVAPSVVAELEMPLALVGQTVASPDGGFYSVAQTDAHPGDVTLWKFTADGELAWTARWGNAYGWNDVAYDVLATSQGVFIAGAAARYEGQEFWDAGHLFVRAYSHGGVVRWTWENPEGPRVSSNAIRPKMLAEHGEDIVVAVVAQEGGEEFLRVVTLSSSGEELRSFEHAEARRLLATYVDDAGDIWIATDALDPWVGHWRADGTFVEALTSVDESGAPKVGAFEPDGSLAIAGARDSPSEELLVVSRFGPALTDQASTAIPIDEPGLWSFYLDVAVDCAGAAWVTARGAGSPFPVRAFGRQADELWSVPGLSTLAVGDDGVALMVGLDPTSGTSVARWLRP